MPRNDLIQLRSDTAANWVSVNPTLAVGETGFETDTGKLKVGTGSSDWNSLIYVTDASDLAGIIPSARISGSYTGITGLGTLTSLTIDGPSSPSFTLGDSAFAGYSGVVGDKGYLLVSDSVGDPAIYLRSSGAGSVYIGQANSNTLQVGNGTVTVAGTILATTVLGSTNRGVGIKADPTNTQAILQFTDNASSAQWASLVATNDLLTVTTPLTIQGPVTLPNNSTSAFANASRTNYWRPQDLSGNSYFRIQSGSFYVDAPNYYFRNSSSAIIMSLASSGEVTVNGTLTATTFSGSAAQLTAFRASHLTGQNGMWTSVTRPGPYRLYRRDNDSNYSVQTYWTGSRWRLYGYSSDTPHADTHVGYADSAGSASTASTAGSSNATTFTGTYVRMSGNGAADPHTEQGLQSGVGGDGAGLALWASGVAPQFRVGASNNTVYLRNANDSIYVTLEGIINDVSSLHLKQDIETFPQILHSAGAAVNEDEILTGLNIVRQLRPVSYKWKEKEHLSQLPENPRRALALSRLNTIRKSKGLEPYDSDELHHDCSRDSCSGTADNPCQWAKNWEIGNIGFISQEVGAIIPQAAILGKEGEFTGLSSLAMTALAVAAIKELDATIQALTARIKQLEESNV